MLQLTEALCHTLGCEAGLRIMVPALCQRLTYDLDALQKKGGVPRASSVGGLHGISSNTSLTSDVLSE